MSEASEVRLRRRLLDWFRENRRPLPFRESPDPWRVLVAEVMLQQTRVGAMLPRYEAFLARFPDPGVLAAAGEDAVLAAWSGLGYYRRARNLRLAARRLAETDAPPTSAWLRDLPGIGPYTAAAVASIAGGEAVAAVDGNIRRVLARLFLVPGAPGEASFEREIRRLADRLMAADGAVSPGDWNQALMELGALVCRPSAPDCAGCPLADGCRAREAGRPAGIPERRRRPAPVSVRLACALIRDPEGRLLLFRRRQRPLSGLYELPGGPCRPGESPREAVVREGKRYGVRVRPGRALPGFRHSVMEKRFTVFPVEAGCDPARPRAGRFVRPDEIGSVPTSSLVTKALRRA